MGVTLFAVVTPSIRVLVVGIYKPLDLMLIQLVFVYPQPPVLVRLVVLWTLVAVNQTHMCLFLTYITVISEANNGNAASLG